MNTLGTLRDFAHACGRAHRQAGKNFQDTNTRENIRQTDRFETDVLASLGVELLYLPQGPLSAHQIALDFQPKDFGLPAPAPADGFCPPTKALDCQQVPHEQVKQTFRRSGFPKNLADLLARKFGWMCERLRERGETLFNGPVVRLTNIQPGREGVKMEMERTSYFTWLLTNFSLGGQLLGAPCPKLQKALRAHCSEEPIHPKGLLANSLAVHLGLLTRDNYQVVVQRSGGHLVQGGTWSSAVSGALDPYGTSVEGGPGDLLVDQEGDRAVVSPVMGAGREAWEEMGVVPDIDDMKLLGVIRSSQHRQPIALFAARLPLTLSEIQERAREAPDGWENDRCLGLPLTRQGRSYLQRGWPEQGMPGIERRSGQPGSWAPKSLAHVLLTFQAAGIKLV